jgi:Zn-dependent peptidase ImmA (M78 family)
MRRIYEVLDLPMQYFLRPVVGGVPDVVFYRSLSSATKAARTRAEQRYEWLREIVQYAETFVELPPTNLPRLDIPHNPAELSDYDIERLAGDLRSYWGLGDGPISNVAWLLEKHGFVVARYEFFEERLDAFSERRQTDGRPYIILNSDKRSAARSRFDAAHEVGHMILHPHVNQRTMNRAEDFGLIEDQAHRFSAAFLVPESTFRREVYTVSLDLFRSLKMKWRTSIAMMIMRARHLGMVSKEDERRLWLNYGRRGWRTHEPLDDCLEPEQPVLVQRSIELILKNKIATPHAITLATGLNNRDIAHLTGVPISMLCEDHDVAVLPMRVPEHP